MDLSEIFDVHEDYLLLRLLDGRHLPATWSIDRLVIPWSLANNTIRFLWCDKDAVAGQFFVIFFSSMQLIVNKIIANNVKKIGPFPDSFLIIFSKNWVFICLFFLYFRLFNTVDRILVIKSLPMTGFELQMSGVGSNRSTNWATSTVPLPSIMRAFLLLGRYCCLLTGLGEYSSWSIILREIYTTL